MKDTQSFIEELKDWDGLKYEHNTSNLEDLLEVLQVLELEVRNHLRRESKYQ